MSKVLVIPGTVWQLPLMKKIKELGHELYVINPVEVDGVYQFADHFYKADIFAEEVVSRYCIEEKIDAVMSDECDIATDIVAKYNKLIGAKGLSIQMAELFTNKYMMREFCQKNNICPIPHFSCNTIEAALGFYSQYGPRIIMKPLDSNSSKGVFTIESERDIENHFQESLSFSRNSKAVLLEQYIDGVEFTADGIMTDKGHRTLAISEKSHYKHNDNIADSLYFSQYSNKFDYDLLRNTNDYLLNKTGLPFGLTHVEYKFCEGSYYLIEMAARGGGNLISAIIAPFMSKVDNYGCLINKTLDENYGVDIQPDRNNDRIALLKFLDLPCEGGIVKDIIGEDVLINEPCIKSYNLNFKIGDKINQPINDSARIGYYIICAENKEEFDEVFNKIKTGFRILVE